MTAQRMLFFTMAALLGAGIFLTGWSSVNWVLYVVPVMLVFAGTTGFCPGLKVYQLMGFK